jgi:hypothetical protein
MKMINLSFLNWHLEIPLSVASILLFVLGPISGGIIFSMLKKRSFEESNKEKNKYSLWHQYISAEEIIIRRKLKVNQHKIKQ